MVACNQGNKETAAVLLNHGNQENNDEMTACNNVEQGVNEMHEDAVYSLTIIYLTMSYDRHQN